MQTQWVKKGVIRRTVDQYGPGTVCMLYARVSSLEQAEKECSIPVQLSDMQEWCRERGWVVAGQYVDVESAYKNGGGQQRVELNRMLAAIASGERRIQYVLIHRLDRLARDSGFAGTLRAALKSHHCSLHAIKEPIDVGTMAGQFASTLMFGQAEFFSATLGLRTKEALRRRLADGWWVTDAPYGYRCVKEEGYKGCGRLVVHAQEAEIVRQVFDLFGDGWGRVRISQQLNAQLYALQNQADPPTLLTEDIVRMIRKRRLYTGILYFGDSQRESSQDETDVFENPAWRIVTDEQFERAQVSRYWATNHRRFKRNSEPTTLSAGFLRCGHCGASCVRSAQVFRCVEARNSGRCVGTGIGTAFVDTTVRNALKQLLHHPQLAEAIQNAWERKQQTAKESSGMLQLEEELRVQEQMIQQMSNAGLPQDLIAHTRRALKEKERLLRQRLALPTAPLDVSVAHRLAESLDGLPLAVGRDLLKILDFRGKLTRESIEMYVTLPEQIFEKTEPVPILGCRGELHPWQECLRGRRPLSQSPLSQSPLSQSPFRV